MVHVQEVRHMRQDLRKFEIPEESHSSCTLETTAVRLQRMRPRQREKGDEGEKGLQMHFRQHTGDKPFNCKICDYKTGDHNTLRRHIMQHTGKYHIKYIVRVVRVVRELQTIFLLQDFDRINVNIVHILRYRVVAIKIT